MTGKRPAKYFTLYLKGIAMGAADVVPGVSGGTIAFISGIYDELVNSIKEVDAGALKLLLRLKPGKFWKKINGWFLLVLFSGILTSIFSLARLMKYLLEEHPVMVWSFFFGLIIASAVVVIRKIASWNISRVIALIAGIVSMYFVTHFSPAETTEAWWFIYISGALAICAMILPGISGAFILLILGKYQFIIGAVGTLDIPVLLVFGFGVVTGLLGFANFLSWLLNRHRELTISLLAGFIIGSLKKIWPWKTTLTSVAGSDGSVIPLLQKNVLPGRYLEITGHEPRVTVAVLLALAGILMVVILDTLVKDRK